jgi:very-short-patch-repair endonuclease
VHSLPERQWTRSLRRFDLPEPVRQQPVRRADGTWYLDGDFQPWDVGVEINGTQHHLVGATGRDDHRRNVLGTGGRLVITLESHRVRHRGGTAVVATAAALLSRGWLPTRQVRQRLEALAAQEGMCLLTGDWLPGAQRRPSAVS